MKKILCAVFLFAIIFQAGYLLPQTKTIYKTGKQKGLSVELGYGMGFQNFGEPALDYNPPGFANASIGYMSLSTFTHLTEASLSYAMFTSIGADVQYSSVGLSSFSDDVYKVNSDVFRLKSKLIYSHGFNSGNSNIIFYVSAPLPGFMTVTKVSYPRLPDPTNSAQRELLNKFTDKMKFGYPREIGIKGLFGKRFSLSVTYENIIIYPDYDAAKDVGMWAFDAAAYSLIKLPFFLTTENYNPSYSLLELLLQGVYAFSTQQLKKNVGMNWPFKSDLPTTVESFRLNIGFTIF